MMLIVFASIDRRLRVLHECRQVKAWRKEHLLGVIPNFPTNLLGAPDPLYAARKFDVGHAQELIESFEEKDA